MDTVTWHMSKKMIVNSMQEFKNSVRERELESVKYILMDLAGLWRTVNTRGNTLTKHTLTWLDEAAGQDGTGLATRRKR